MSLSSANSINISRLIPQAIYYSAAAGRAYAGRIDSDGEATPREKGIRDQGSGIRGDDRKLGVLPSSTDFGQQPRSPITFAVPSGNFGNLTAGLYAMKMGAPIYQFIAATNINRTVPDYLDTGEYLARVSQATISNAMDVGAPSNFERMAAHFSWEEMRRIILGVAVSDEETRETIVQVHNRYGYFLDPHSAVGWKGVDKLAAEHKLSDGPVGVLCTAHPAKFSEVVTPLVGPPPVPATLKRAMGRTVHSQTIPADVSAFIDILHTIDISHNEAQK